MAKETYAHAMRRGVLPHEGGYVNHPRDPGGETNYGITVKVARANGYTGPMRDIPMSAVERIYRERYANPLRYDDLPAGLDYCVLDYGINSGTGRAGKVLRRVLGLPADTPTVDDNVVARARALDTKRLIGAICDERLRFLKSLSTWDTFGKGWERRVREVRAMALAMANGAGLEAPAGANAPAAGKGEYPNPTKMQAGSAGSAIVAGGAAARQAHEAGMRPWIVALIAIAAVLIAVGAVAWLKIRRDRMQEA